MSTSRFALLLFSVALASSLTADPQQPKAKTDLPGKGPCTNFPARYQKVELRMAWFWGCMHEDPPSIADVKARIAALTPEARKKIEQFDFITREAMIGIQRGDLPIQVIPE